MILTTRSDIGSPRNVVNVGTNLLTSSVSDSTSMSWSQHDVHVGGEYSESLGLEGPGDSISTRTTTTPENKWATCADRSISLTFMHYAVLLISDCTRFICTWLLANTDEPNSMRPAVFWRCIV
jgi:hypothetical protein